MTARAKLRNSISARLIPALKARGFSGPDKISGNIISQEFTRPKGSDTEIVDIQFEKRQKPRFVINLRIEPPGGSEEIIARGSLSIQGRITPNRGVCTRSWFRADRPFWQRLLGMQSTLEDQAVTQALAFLDAIDDWFREPRDTPAVRTITFDWGKIRNAEKTNGA